jgi:Chromate transport protein ChrA
LLFDEENKVRLKRLTQLFWITFKLSAFTPGGGYAIVAMLDREFRIKRGWLNEREILDYTAIAQSSTGSIAINAALLVGRKIGGKTGAAVALLASTLPPLIIMTLIAAFYSLIKDNSMVRALLLGMQAATAAVIVDASITLAQAVWRDDKLFAAIVAVATFILTAFTQVNSAIIIAGAAMAGLLRVLRVSERVK